MNAWQVASPRWHRHACSGMSLLEVLTVAAVVGIVSAMALPSYQARIDKSRRQEAVSALTRLQLAQESFRANHGVYALGLQGLQGLGEAPTHYHLALGSTSATGYTAHAIAKRPGPASDTCAELFVSVNDGQTVFGPNETCWSL